MLSIKLLLGALVLLLNVSAANAQTRENWQVLVVADKDNQELLSGLQTQTQLQQVLLAQGITNFDGAALISECEQVLCAKGSIKSLQSHVQSAAPSVNVLLLYSWQAENPARISLRALDPLSGQLLQSVSMSAQQNSRAMANSTKEEVLRRTLKDASQLLVQGLTSQQRVKRFQLSVLGFAQQELNTMVPVLLTQLNRVSHQLTKSQQSAAWLLPWLISVDAQFAINTQLNASQFRQQIQAYIQQQGIPAELSFDQQNRQFTLQRSTHPYLSQYILWSLSLLITLVLLTKYLIYHRQQKALQNSHVLFTNSEQDRKNWVAQAVALLNQDKVLEACHAIYRAKSLIQQHTQQAEHGLKQYKELRALDTLLQKAFDTSPAAQQNRSIDKGFLHSRSQGQQDLFFACEDVSPPSKTASDAALLIASERVNAASTATLNAHMNASVHVGRNTPTAPYKGRLIAINHSAMSRVGKHGRFDWQHGQLQYCDLGSSNGSAINHQGCKANHSYSLHNQDVLSFAEGSEALHPLALRVQHERVGGTVQCTWAYPELLTANASALRLDWPELGTATQEMICKSWWFVAAPMYLCFCKEGKGQKGKQLVWRASMPPAGGQWQAVCKLSYQQGYYVSPVDTARSPTWLIRLNDVPLIGKMPLHFVQQHGAYKAQLVLSIKDHKSANMQDISIELSDESPL